MSERIKIKYFNKDAERLCYIGGDKSNWIDFRAAEDAEMTAGEYKMIPLGVAMQLPTGYEAHIMPRSSTFKNFGIIMACSGIIDNSYSGNEDEWKFGAFAARNTTIHKGDRICQFRIIKNQPEISFEEVDYLANESRGGFGSTGIK